MTGKKPKKKIGLNRSKKGRNKDLSNFTKVIGPKIDPVARSMCLKCRGAKNLCGKKRCPILIKFFSKKEKKQKIFDSRLIDGNSPPSVFIGRNRYPKPKVGPLVPPEKGDTSLYGSPENWFGETDLEEIVSLRTSLVRGKKRLESGVRIYGAKLDREIRDTRFLVLSGEPAGTEVKFDKKIGEGLKLSPETQPHGPSGNIEEMNLRPGTSDKQLEKIFYDKDLKAEKGVLRLYQKGTPISRIQDLFMIGGTGLEKKRKFVPTRWSITAVDDIIGRNLRKKVKKHRPLDVYEIYKTQYLDNKWMVIFTPEIWKYELIEAFYPETTWNPWKNEIVVFGDHEPFTGRKDYASIGGCYYSARLAVTEKLEQKKRQAGVIVLREAHPGYVLPVGVWNVRESVRNALSNKPTVLETKGETLAFIERHMDLDLKEWKNVSTLLKNYASQKRLKDFQ